MHAGTGPLVVGFDEVGAVDVAMVGGKGANLAELWRLEGVEVPPGCCITTEAFRAGDLEALRGPLRDALAVLGDERTAWAVRSSATAEDLPTASFAGQHDSYLGIVGLDAVVEHVARCWASRSTDRAVAYRERQAIAHDAVEMAVVVQRMVDADASGVLFTADPATSNRRTCAVEAVPGLGDGLVSGRVAPDGLRVRAGEVVERTPAPGRASPTLTDEQAVELAALGRRIEAAFGAPQDIEWCLADRRFLVVQSRPITTLFPIPVADDDRPHVYVSVGHQQMMTDPMRPLGLSMWQLVAARPMLEAGGRPFIDVSAALASPPMRAGLLDVLGRSDPLIRDALEAVVASGLVPEVPGDGPPISPLGPSGPLLDADPKIVAELIARHETSVEALERDLAGKEGLELLELIDDVAGVKRLLFQPEGHAVIVTLTEAMWWLDEHLGAWLGERGIVDVLSQSAPGNVTAEMGLALLDVADAIRPHADVVALLEAVGGDDAFLDRLPSVAGGGEAKAAIDAYLARYGARCVGEIDITRPRWREQPSALVPAILANVERFEPGEAARRFEHGRQRAEAKATEVLARLRRLPDGEAKAAEAAAMIARVRTFAGYREYPKYGMVQHLFAYKRALLAEADRLVAAGVLRRRDDLSFLRFEELRDVVADQRADLELLDRRRAEHARFASLRAPRVLTSDGDALDGSYHRDDLPEGVLVGLAVSSGIVEGRARVVLEMGDADLEPGDILVTRFTDPSWSPSFVGISGLVTEVGGLMTHGAVIAREYGLPAVVGVDHATTRLGDGQRIRLDGTAGTIEVLADVAPSR